MNSIADILKLSPVMPVLTIEDARDAVPLAAALIEGGLRVLEVTLRTDAALAAIATIARDLPDAIVGAGTVQGPRLLDEARCAGARFAVSPGLSDALSEAAKGSGFPFLPGIATASEAMRGLDQGFTHFKFFPAESMGGVQTLSAFAGPLPQARFVPTGGITQANAPDYLALANVVAVGGTWLAPKALIEARDWAAIAGLARAASAL
ncbi:MAG TPA: bifunctional 4-hydroxy-2-oxoglutarate aldolase/2-dehydro-3-deoxy-phosphogluconate aldolase [Rhizomicrobium sp.]|nr:bifunctional 4-hydroxy-2-oxoglutarate aldolase/2-dehydro-3-deoxy-phosphogluconate aldolase [Rhizomicrobium sp.]